MINLEKILKQDSQIRATTGLNRKVFEALLPSFEEAYQQTLDKKRRWRAAGEGQELTEEQKQENREFSSQRVKCEHAHAGMKRYNSVTAVYRNHAPDFDDRLSLRIDDIVHPTLSCFFLFVKKRMRLP